VFTGNSAQGGGFWDGGLETGRRRERGGVWELWISNFIYGRPVFPYYNTALAPWCCGVGDLGLHFSASMDVSNLRRRFPVEALSSCQVEDHRGPCSKVAIFLGFPAENEPLFKGNPLIFVEYIKKNNKHL